MIVQTYVDDIMFEVMSRKMVEHQVEFEMRLVGELTYFLGFQVKQMKEGIFFSQSKYAKNIVTKFCLENARHKHTPTATCAKLNKDDKGVEVDQILYRSMIGSLLYLIVGRPNIILFVGACARYQAKPKVCHLTEVKRIIKYINETCDFGILYSHVPNLFQLDIIRLIGQAVLKIEIVPPVDVFPQETILSIGLEKIKILSRYQLLKLNTFLLEAVALNSCG